MVNVFLVVVSSLVVLCVLNGKLRTAVMAQFSKLGSFLWGVDKIAVREHVVQESAKKVRGGVDALSETAGHVERLRRSKTQLEKEETVLENRLKTAIASGNKDQQLAVAKLLNTTRNKKTGVTEKLTQWETAYNNNLERMKAAQDALKDQKSKTREMASELQMSKTEKELASLNANLADMDFGDFSELADVDEAIQAETDKNRGAARVAAEMSGQGLEQIRAQKAAQDAEAEALLAQYQAEFAAKK